MKIEPKSVLYYYIKYNWLCQYCKCKTILLKDEKNRKFTRYIATRDHLYPICKGGTWEESNIVLACRKCNMDKKDY